jgi:hypothetical protein
VIFASFGAPSEYLEHYVKDRVERSGNRMHWIESMKHPFNHETIVNLADHKDVELRFDGLNTDHSI